MVVRVGDPGDAQDEPGSAADVTPGRMATVVVTNGVAAAIRVR
jgi:hypothetical protein